MRTTTLSTGLVFLTICLPSFGQQLIVAYDFEGEIGNAFAADKSGHGTALDAFLASGALIVNDPVRGHVLQTSSSGFGAQTLYDAKLDFTTSFTLQARVKAPVGSPVFQHIAGRPGAGPRLFNHWGLGGLGAAQRDDPFQGFNPVDFGPGGESDGEWHHLLVTWNHTTGDLTGCYDGSCKTKNDPASRLVTHPGLIFSIGGNPVSNPAGNPLPNTRVDDVAFWNGWADSAATTCLANETCSIYNAPIVAPSSPPPPNVYPFPIERDAFGNFFINNTGSFEPSGLNLDIRRFAQIPDSNGLARPRLNALRFAPGVGGLFVVDEGFSGQDSPPSGSIYHVSSDGSVVTEVINIGTVLPVQQTGLLGQGGVRSLAFHPEFSQLGSPGYGKLYTTQLLRRSGNESPSDYVGPKDPALNFEGGFPNINRYDGVLGEWRATFDEQGHFSGIDLDSFRQVLRVATPSTQHPMKQISFNPLAKPSDEDYGLLYLLHGDGVNSESQGTGLDGSNALGKVLRIEPLQDGTNPYSIPPTNPLVGNPAYLDEIFTLGHRNVHTISFGLDSQGESRIIVSEIGQASVEEINLLTPGANYGWGDREGTFRRVGNGIGQLTEIADSYTYPVAQYGHLPTGGNAIAGGYIVNNNSELNGYYFFGDFSNGDKPMFAISMDDAISAVTTGGQANLAPTQPLTVDLWFDHDDDPSTPSISKTSFLDIVDDELAYDGSGRTDLRFGQGPQGELYLLNKRNGWIYVVTNSLPMSPSADFNRDGIVNGLDLLIWEAGFGTISGATLEQGDADGDEIIDGTDFLRWQQQFVSGIPSSSMESTRVPEPSVALIMHVVTLICLASVRHLKCSRRDG